MVFYPQTLKHNWYMVDVCNSITASLEGAKYWTSFYYENKAEREAYLETFTTCQRIVLHYNLQPKEMIRALSSYHDLLPTLPKPPFFSLARWIYKPLEARDRAVRVVFELVDGISGRFLS
jgi:hypothetical protein